MKPALFVDRPSDHEPPPDWSDTVPACFRSEAFAEDLSAADRAATSTGPQPQRAGPRRRRPWAAWLAALALVGRRRAAAH